MGIGNLIGVAEAYPELKASENFAALQRDLASVEERISITRRVYNDTFAAIIERGQAEGLYRTDIPRAVLVAHFFSDVHYLSTWYSPEGPEDKTVLAQQITDLYLASIAAPSAPTGD